VLSAARGYLAPMLDQLPLRLTLHIDATPPGYEGKFTN
jgi:5-carboxymethyl-2-hydroxymuconate isomerase